MLRSHLGILVLVGAAGALAFIACKGDDPLPITGDDDDDNASSSSSGNASSTSSSGASTSSSGSSEAGPPSDFCGARRAEAPAGADFFCTRFAPNESALPTLTFRGEGVFDAAAKPAESDPFSLHGESATDSVGLRGGFAEWTARNPLSKSVKRVVLHARVRPLVDSTQLDASKPGESFAELMRIDLGGDLFAAIRYSRLDPDVESISGHYLYGSAVPSGIFGCSPTKPLKKDVWADVSITLLPDPKVGSMRATMGDADECVSGSEYEIVAKGSVKLRVGNYADGTVTVPNGHLFDDVWAFVEYE